MSGPQGALVTSMQESPKLTCRPDTKWTVFRAVSLAQASHGFQWPLPPSDSLRIGHNLRVKPNRSLIQTMKSLDESNARLAKVGWWLTIAVGIAGVLVPLVIALYVSGR